jgi:hypothetical protein
MGMFLSKKQRANLMRHLIGTDRNAAAFRHFNRYLILKRVNKGQVSGLIVRKSGGFWCRIHLPVAKC